MPSRLVLALILAFTPVLAGCLTSESLVRLRADGSGTMETTFLVNEDAMKNMAGMFGGDMQEQTTSSMPSFDPATLQAEAAKLGPGVRLVSSEPVTRGALKGARMVYAFDDVNALQMNTDPMSAAAGSPKAGEGRGMTMRLTRQPNGNALLTVDMGESSSKSKTPTKSAAPAGKMDLDELPPGMDTMIAGMLDGFRILIDVEVDGAIVKTNTPFVAGPRVTLLEMDFGALLKDKTGMTKLMSVAPGTSTPEMAETLKDVNGIKVSESPLTIEFAPR